MSDPPPKQQPLLSLYGPEESFPFIDQDGSDYGDFGTEEELTQLEDILTQLNSQTIEPRLLVTDIEDHEPPLGVRLPKILGVEQTTRSWEVQATLVQPDQAPINLQATDSGTQRRKESRDLPGQESVEPDNPMNNDKRPPLERFRRPPKKTLSVTDLISPAWCELQYLYTLSKHGKKKRTPAMKQGTVVHKALEDEVHTTVQVSTTKREDSWGLRIWNIIQGLRTLRDTGRTREFEVWGTVGGELVNGVIDELSYTCPDPAVEAVMNGTTNTSADSNLPEYQTSITDYILNDSTKAQDQRISEDMSVTARAISAQSSRKLAQRIYITDVKTRASPTLPTGSSIRPTVLQLHLYHHMLENFVQGNFSLVQLAERHGFDVNETFSDSFIAQVGGLNQDLFDTFSSTPEASAQVASSQNSMDLLLQHNNLSSLWDFMISQFRDTFLLPSQLANATPTPTPQSTRDLPAPNAQPTRLSPLLTAEYLAPTYKHAAGTRKQSIGHKSLVFNPEFLKTYLEASLAWWRGEREARGVDLQEAWKCRSCDFRDDCEWIHERDNAALQQALERRKMRETAGVEGTGAPTSSTGAVVVGSKSKV